MTSTFHSQTIRHLLFIGNWCPKGSSPCPNQTQHLQGISQIELPDSVKQSMGQECHPVHHRYHCCLLGCHCCCRSPQSHWLGWQRHHQQHGQKQKPEWGVWIQRSKGKNDHSRC